MKSILLDLLMCRLFDSTEAAIMSPRYTRGNAGFNTSSSSSGGSTAATAAVAAAARLGGHSTTTVTATAPPPPPAILATATAGGGGGCGDITDHVSNGSSSRGVGQSVSQSQMLVVKVNKTGMLQPDMLVTNPVVRLHVVSAATGRYLQLQQDLLGGVRTTATATAATAAAAADSPEGFSNSSGGGWGLSKRTWRGFRGGSGVGVAGAGFKEGGGDEESHVLVEGELQSEVGGGNRRLRELGELGH